MRTYSEHMDADSFSLLQQRIALIERRDLAVAAATHVTTGHKGIDRALGGGLLRARVHELIVPDSEEAGSGAGFASVLARRLDGELLWLREDAAERRMGRLHVTGLAEIGIDPARLVVGVLSDPAAVLRAAADGLRCPALGTVVIELWGDPRPLDLTATRRLALAAEASGVTALLLRVGGQPAPSAAHTRLRVAATPSLTLVANAPGLPAWDIELQRQRGGATGGSWRVEWDRERGVLRDQEYDTDTVSRPLVSTAADRPAGVVAGIRHG